MNAIRGSPQPPRDVSRCAKHRLRELPNAVSLDVGVLEHAAFGSRRHAAALLARHFDERTTRFDSAFDYDGAMHARRCAPAVGRYLYVPRLRLDGIVTRRREARTLRRRPILRSPRGVMSHLSSYSGLAFPPQGDTRAASQRLVTIPRRRAGRARVTGGISFLRVCCNSTNRGVINTMMSCTLFFGGAGVEYTASKIQGGKSCHAS